MKAPAAVFAPLPPDDGREWDCQCARCGSSIGWDDFGRRRFCLSGYEWCAANPLPGRVAVKRGEIEWFVVPGREVAP